MVLIKAKAAVLVQALKKVLAPVALVQAKVAELVVAVVVTMAVPIFAVVVVLKSK